MSSFAKITKLNLQKLDKNVSFCVWVNKIRKLGNLLFIVGQDSSDKIQIVVKKEELITKLKEIRRGDLLKVWGILRKKTGSEKEMELELTKYQLINSSKKLPFEIKDDVNINEDTRYRYRYLDLRRPSSKNFLVIKNQFLHEVRNFLHKSGFIDVETPILTQSSPEGAKCFIVPSNLENRYYTLPQSAQMFKQLLMMSGFNKYYSVAKSFRNEDARSNRQIEFSQLELETSFMNSHEIKKLVERLIKSILKKIFGYQINKKFATMTYQEVMEKYGTDKPDLRKNNQDKNELAFLWITDWPLFEYNQETKKYDPFRHPFTIPQKKYIKPLLKGKIKLEQVICDAFDLVCNGEEILSGSCRIYQRELQEKVLEILGYDKENREENFGYFLQALEFAAPPHGGFGLGIDRLLAIMLNANNLKELIAFPKNIDGTCSLTGAPNVLKNK
jgi:aspartyl-tRNA synthetase